MSLTANDLQQVKKIVKDEVGKSEKRINKKFDNHPTHQDFQELMVMIDEKFEKFRQELPNKDELYNKLDAIMHELVDHRIEREAMSYQLENLNDWKEKHNKLHQKLGLTG